MRILGISLLIERLIIQLCCLLGSQEGHGVWHPSVSHGDRQSCVAVLLTAWPLEAAAVSPLPNCTLSSWKDRGDKGNG